MMKNWIKKIIAFSTMRRSGPGAMANPTEKMRRVLKMLEMTEENEYSCDDAYDLLDVYADMKERGEDTAALMPLVEFHIKMCGNCREEFEALLKAIQAKIT